MRFSVLLALGCALLVTVPSCGGDSKSSSTKKKKKKKSGSAKYEAEMEKLRVWLASNESDWPGFKKKAASTRKKVSKSKKYKAAVDLMVTEQKEYYGEVLKLKLGQIGNTSQDPANAAYWQKYLGQFDDLDKELAGFDEKFAAELAPEISTWRVKIVKGVYKEEVQKWLRKNRTKVAEVLAKVKEWRAHVEKLGDAGKEMMDELNEMETNSKDLEGWMTRLPPDGPINLLDPTYREAWDEFAAVKTSWEGNELIIEGTGEKRGDFGSFLHRSFWWTDFEVTCAFEIEGKGFIMMFRAHPPKTGANQAASHRTFSSERGWRLTCLLQGTSMETSGDVNPSSKSVAAGGGGVGFYVSPGTKAKIVMFEVTKK